MSFLDPDDLFVETTATEAKQDPMQKAINSVADALIDDLEKELPGLLKKGIPTLVSELGQEKVKGLGTDAVQDILFEGVLLGLARIRNRS